MLSLLSNKKKSFITTLLNVSTLVTNIAILIYLTSLFGFDHINTEFLKNISIGFMSVGVIIATILIIVSFIIYASFKIASNKANDYINSLIETSKNGKKID